MRRIYTFFLYLFMPLIILRLLFKSRKNRAYRQRIAERFAFNKSIPQKIDIWLHAVSLGEVVAATPLIDAFLQSKHRVLVTTMTPSGSKQVLNKFGKKVFHQYVPYDLPCCLKKFFKAAKPKVGIIIETEIWPNLIYYAKLSNVKLGLVNARISDKAFVQYQKTGKLFKPILNNFNFIATQSKLDADRYIALGADSKIVSVVGNIKFDVEHPRGNLKDLSFMQRSWGNSRPVFLAASTHDNEEWQLLINFQKIKKLIPDVILLIAPRHAERFAAVYDLSVRLGFKTAKRSQDGSITADKDVVILDSMGELLDFYNISDYAFVGGSLVPIGGHNVIEAILMGVPVFCGPFMQNSKAICDELLDSEAMIIAKDVDDLILNIGKLHNNVDLRIQQIANAEKVLKANRGVLLKYLNAIEALL